MYILISATTKKSSLAPVQIHFAINSDDEKFLNELIQRGVNLEYETKGFTPLLLTIWSNRPSLAVQLIRGGADGNHSVENQTPHRTAIHMAADEGYISVIDALIEKGVSVDALDKSGRSALHIAARSNHRDLVDFLLTKGACLELQDEFLRTPLIAAAEMGSVSAVDCLLNRGANVHARTRDGWSALTYCVVQDGCDLAERLIREGADVNHCDYRLSTALHQACQRMSFFQRNVLASTTDRPYAWSRPASSRVLFLSGPSFLEWLPMISLLLNNGADVRKMDTDGYTCLDWAVLQKLDDASVSLLVQAGAQLNKMPSDKLPIEKSLPTLPTTASLQSLQQIAIRVIRLSIQRDIDEKVDSLPLPPILRRAVSLAPENRQLLGWNVKNFA